MKFSFAATIYKVGINPCVTVPARITKKMIPSKGYIPIKGKINNHLFIQTLVPVKNTEYRLFVNGPMLKGANAQPGDSAKFIIEQDFASRTADDIEMPKEFKKRLDQNNLFATFKKLTDYRQKEILKYFNYLKTEEALQRNIIKVITELKKKIAND